LTALLVLTFIYFDRLVAMLRGLVADVSIGIGTGGAGGFTTLVDTTGTTTDNTAINTSFTRNGQTFTTPASTVSNLRCSWRLWISGDGGGIINARLYATSGSVPTGSPIATSAETVDLTDLPGTKPTEFNGIFNFTGLSLATSTLHAIAIEYTVGPVPGESVNLQRVGNTYGGGTHVAFTSSWLTLGTEDLELKIEYS